MAAVTITVPLVPYEKKLLDNFRASFPDRRPAGCHSHQERHDYAFSRWYWARFVQENFRSTFQSDYNLHKADWSRIWKIFIHKFRTPADESNFSRVETLELNHYPERWDYGIPILHNVKAIPNENDLPYWDFIAELLTFYEEAEPAYSDPLVSQGLPVQGIKPENCTVEALVEQIIIAALEGGQPPELSETQLEIAYAQHWSFQIWGLVRSCALLNRRNEGVLSVKEGLRMAGFYDRHDAVRNGFILKPSGDRSSGSLVQPIEQNSRRYYTARTPKSLKLGSFGMDPVKYVEHIPWADLHPCSPDHLTREFQAYRFMYWTPRKSIRAERFLYTEEDVFQFCVEFNMTFPDYLFNDHILFILSRITEFTFKSLGDDYWKCWSDCAITKHPQTREWFLLQTVPGFRFRSLRTQQNRTASLRYFRNIVDDVRFGRPQQLSDVLGPYFQPNYRNLLNLIPCEQISYIYPNPIGAGDKGVVRRAVWSCPQRIGMWSSQEIEIALKSLKVQDTQNLEKFVRELDASFTAFQDANRTGGCIELLGVLMTPSREAHNAHNGPISVLQMETLFLVLEFATEGPLINYLERTLIGQQSDWEAIIQFISDLANGLEGLHNQGVIHRDIHPGNVLVTTRKARGMPDRGLPQKPIALIADLGESQLISYQYPGRASYGNREYWAPEIHSSHQYSTASDVYAMGCITANIVALNWRIASNGTVSNLIPEVILRIIIDCLNPFPERRPSAAEVCQTLEDAQVSMECNGLQLVPIDMDIEALQSLFSWSGNEPSESSSGEIPK
ncbi:MAG: hypothetical protein M1839_000598 [Geoglossum umbratile]|nr:MAG: hypothetical protein M1839_000598 [Geoglossum umbratile]